MKKSSLRIFEKVDCTKDVFLHTSNIRMRPLILRGGSANLNISGYGRIV